MVEIFRTAKSALIDRNKLREKINKLYDTATAEQKTILLRVMEIVETAEPQKEETH